MARKARSSLHGAWLAVAAAVLTTPASALENPRASDIAAAKPGAVLRIWPLEGGVRPDYKGYRILYRSTGASGQAIAVSGAVLFPAAPADAPRRVLAWAHPTTGIKTACAPTLNGNLTSTIPGIDYFTDAGFVIVATDYEGLGGPGVHPYLVGDSAAHTVLDSVRAARSIRDVHAGHRAALWGHSQGGHAVLFAAADAPRYAPEIDIVAVAAAAPATDLVALFEADRKTASGRSLTAMAIYSWSRVFDFPATDFVEQRAIPAMDRLAGDCIETIEGLMRGDNDTRDLGTDFLVRNPTEDPRIRKIMEKNSAGPLPPATPVFIAQGTADTVVRPEISRAYAKRLCNKGSKVRFLTLDGVPHITVGRDAAYAAYTWIDARFAGRTPPSDC